ncbi:MauE/DoxX family redox-associated membrane protein [Parapedobacter sp. 10938]|uniref:MauE/DoxX family redox-associated membrane protein n=1 Tax=Parapedobacter flavus TaxID=3110225 RepID=UPI002DB73F4C|nr:MauE/DoxX family redox-associated membrane protein [Parapedobacter sp. 10938]MEC3879323.1 MauE/DoxX family redox-associated membrane protein [Parapedobacter sp. 10938]
MALTINNKAKPQTKALSWGRVISAVLTYPLSVLFAMAAATKVMKYATYRSYLHESGLVGEGVAFWLSFTLSALELILAGLLAWPKTRRVGLLATLALLPFYQYYVYYALNEALFTPCGCLGALPISWAQHYTLNIVVLIMSILTLAMTYRTKQRKPTHDKRGSP